MANYRKLIAHILAIVVIILGLIGIDTGAEGTIFGLELDVLVTAIVGIISAFGVWRAPNDPPKPAGS